MKNNNMILTLVLDLILIIFSLIIVKNKSIILIPGLILLFLDIYLLKKQDKKVGK